MLVSAVSYASEKPKMTITANDEQIVSVQFESSEPTWFELTVQDTKGEVVYHKKLRERTARYKQQIDFSKLKKGNYFVCVNYGNRSLNSALSVSPNGVEISPAEFFYEPYFEIEGEKLNISFLNVAQKGVYLSIYKKDKLVYGIYLGNEMSIQKRLVLNQAEKGEYKIVLREWFKNHSAQVQL